MVRLFVVLAEHLIQDDRVPARQTLFDGDEVLSGPAAKAKFLDEVQVRQNAACHNRLPAMWFPPGAVARAHLGRRYRKYIGIAFRSKNANGFFGQKRAPPSLLQFADPLRLGKSGESAKSAQSVKNPISPAAQNHRHVLRFAVSTDF